MKTLLSIACVIMGAGLSGAFVVLTAPLAIDHLGLLGAPVHPFDLTRAAGVVLLVLGVVLIRWT